MSGPKSSRYQLTPEQRKALEEARRRELERRRALASLSLVREGLDTKLSALTSYFENAALLLKRDGEDLGFSERFSRYRDDAVALRGLASLPEDCELEVAKEALEAVTQGLEAVESSYKELVLLGEEVNERLASSIENTLKGGMTVSFADLDEKKEEAKKRISYRRELLLIERDDRYPQRLRKRAREALIALTEAESLSLFEALSYDPLMRKARYFMEEYALYEKEYHELKSEYHALCRLCEITPLEVECSRQGVDMLLQYVRALRYEIAYDDEESYIDDVLNTVMREMGYHVLAERTVNKRTGKRFSHTLYTYRDGTVVNVTTADDGKITMELGKPDRVDRLPSEAETDMLCMEMEAFCRDFAEIEERLRAYGVVVSDRITMLPPTAEYAQIINTEDYETVGTAVGEEGEDALSRTERFQKRLINQRKKFRQVMPTDEKRRKKPNDT